MRKAFICPTKYVQGEDEILNLGLLLLKADLKESVPARRLQGCRKLQKKMDAPALLG